ncbi:hypothetical protein E2542_SST24675 [Spatholobus suberectus]|nr:hypothetical protein E2542_SST24675 [Spatholobus suberectus]
MSQRFYELAFCGGGRVVVTWWSRGGRVSSTMATHMLTRCSRGTQVVTVVGKSMLMEKGGMRKLNVMRVKRDPSEIDIALGGLKRSHRSSPRTQRNLKLAFHLGLAVTSCEVTKPEPNGKVKPHIDVENPFSSVFVEIQLIEHHHVLPRENRAHAVRALGVLAERVLPRDHVRGGEPDAVVGHVALHSVVVDVEPPVGVSRGEVEDEVVAEGGVGVVELREPCFRHMEPERAGLDHGPEDEEYEDDEDDDCEEKLPEEAEEAQQQLLPR